MGLGIGHHTAPERVVDQRVVDDRAPLEGERADVQRRRMAIERHVAYGCDAAGGRGDGASRKTFPIGSAGLVEVDVRVDNAGQDVQTGGVDPVVSILAMVWRQDGLNSAVLD